MMEHCNLLPAEFQRRLLIRHRLWQWSFVWGATTVVIAGLVAHRVNFLLSHETRLQHMEQRCEPLRKQVAEIRDLRTRLQEMNGRELLASELDGARYPLELMGLVSQTARACGPELQIRRFKLWHDAKPAGPPTKAERKSTGETTTTPKSEVICLTLAGLATDGLAVARFATALRETRVFESVELKSSIAGRIGDVPTREYELSCTF